MAGVVVDRHSACDRYARGWQAWRAYEFQRFKHYNRYQGVVLAEISPNAERLPNVRMLPIVPNRHIEKLFWFFTTNSASPVADHMRNLRDMFETTLREAGLPPVAD